MTNNNTKLNSILSKYSTLGLSDLPKEFLMRRQETKFILNTEQLLNCLELFRNECAALIINESLTHKYESKYFDSDDLKSYNDHHRGKSQRFKMRKRKYHSNGATFFELKLRNNKKYIQKFRIPSDFSKNYIVDEEKNLIYKHLSGSDFTQQKLVLQNDYDRIVLINSDRRLRITFDYNISFYSGNQSSQIDDVVIAELKYEKIPKDYIDEMTKLGASQTSFSKYCVGTAILNPNVKRNNFKQNLVKIKKWNS